MGDDAACIVRRRLRPLPALELHIWNHLLLCPDPSWCPGQRTGLGACWEFGTTGGNDSFASEQKQGFRKGSPAHGVTMGPGNVLLCFWPFAKSAGRLVFCPRKGPFGRAGGARPNIPPLPVPFFPGFAECCDRCDVVRPNQRAACCSFPTLAFRAGLKTVPQMHFPPPAQQAGTWRSRCPRGAHRGKKEATAPLDSTASQLHMVACVRRAAEWM